MERAKNDATLQKIGDIYQNYVGLLECFKMDKNDSLTFELTGDITKLSSKNSFQMEVKHHLKDSKLQDRDIDFWKTLRNWYVGYDLIENHKKLILFTTSYLEIDSNFYTWNEKNELERLNLLKNIGSIVKKSEKKFRPLYEEIFSKENYSEEKLKNIVKKFEIISKQQKIHNIDMDFEKYIPHIPKDKRVSFVAHLLGVILDKVRYKPHIWEIKYVDFTNLLQISTPLFLSKDATPLVTEYMDVPLSEKTKEENQNKIFVKEIENINYHKQIPQAVRDVWRCNMTIIKYYENNLTFNRGISEYKLNLLEKLIYTKESYILTAEDSDRNNQIKESKKFYSEVMGWDALPFKTVSLNQSFFQRGIIHDIVDNKDLKWDVGEDS